MREVRANQNSEQLRGAAASGEILPKSNPVLDLLVLKYDYRHFKKKICTSTAEKGVFRVVYWEKGNFLSPAVE